MRVFINTENTLDKFVREYHTQLLKGKKVVLSDVALDLGFCERILFNEIKFYTQVSPITLINLMRFFAAKELLLFEYSIEETMEAIKVDSYSHFYESFVKYFSIPPKKFYIKTKDDKSVYSNILLHKDSNLFEVYKIQIRKSLYDFYSDQMSKKSANYLNSDIIFRIWIETYFNGILKKIKTTSNNGSYGAGV